MKIPLALLVLVMAATGAMAQSEPRGNNNSQLGPLAAGPFQALGNVIRNPDADPPRTPRATPPTEPAPPPSIFPPGVLINPRAPVQAPPR